MATVYKIILSILAFSALVISVNCTEDGCGGIHVANSKIKITGADIMGYPENVKFVINDCVFTLTEDLDFKEIQNISVSYEVKKGAIHQKDGPIDLCEGLKDNSDNENFACLINILDTKECPIPEGLRRGSCDLSSKRNAIHKNARIAKGKTEFKLEFFTDKGETVMEGFVDIQKSKKEKEHKE